MIIMVIFRTCILLCKTVVLAGREKERQTEDKAMECTDFKLGEALRKAENRKNGYPIILGSPKVI